MFILKGLFIIGVIIAIIFFAIHYYMKDYGKYPSITSLHEFFENSEDEVTVINTVPFFNPLYYLKYNQYLRKGKYCFIFIETKHGKEKHFGTSLTIIVHKVWHPFRTCTMSKTDTQSDKIDFSISITSALENLSETELLQLNEVFYSCQTMFSFLKPE